MKIRKFKSQPWKMQIVENPLSREVMIPSLPEEIIEEILSRLAVESLLKFRLVSKSWRSLIDSQRFIQTHQKYSIKNPNFPHQRFILHHGYDPPKQCSLQNLLSARPAKPSTCDHPINLDWSTSEKILGCYNGLVCILDDSGQFIVWNPSTRMANKLPGSTNLGCYVRYPGFGWIESTEEYKVFAVVFDLYTKQKVAKVYSSKTESWKIVQPWDSLPYCFVGGTCVSEKLHWDNGECIVWFDLKSELIGTIELPCKIDGEHRQSSLGVIGGCLSAVNHYDDGRGIWVWVMKEYGVKESWVRLASLPRVLELLKRPQFSSPLIIGENGEILVLFGSCYMIYYPHDNVSLCCEIPYGFRYIESLVSPEVV